VLGTAIALATLFDATPVALHVRECGIESPEELATAAGVGLREVAGKPIEQIVAAAKEHRIAAVAIGTRGVHGGPQPAGRTALEVITQVEKPVVVVPPHARPPERFVRLLVPLDGTSESSRALDDTIRLADRRHLEILALHVHSPATVPVFADHEPHATEAWNQEFLRRHIAAPHENVRLLRHLGVPAADIVTAAKETRADLVILAWSQDLGEGHAQVVSETLAHSLVPVLLLLQQRRAVGREGPPTPIGRSPYAQSSSDPDAIARAAGLDHQSGARDVTERPHGPKRVCRNIVRTSRGARPRPAPAE
jgi:nucleotide-binding universal stress UspA family protein